MSQAVQPQGIGPDGQPVPFSVTESGALKSEMTAGGEPISADNPLKTETLGTPTVPRQLAITTTSASATLTASCRRISIRARGCDMRYVIGTGAQTANAGTSHFIAQDERLDLAVPAGATIAAIRETAATANGSLAITELA
jgi:hypothetical protein